MLLVRKPILWTLFVITASAFGQQTNSPNQRISTDPQVIVVTGSFQPTPLSEINRAVVAIDLEQQPPLYNSLIDPLHADASIDLQERAPGGVQSDISIRGATFEQSLILVNGLRLNDAQSGHHDLDVPLPMEAVSRVEILHGAGSTLYGADAMAGAVNFITDRPPATELRLRVGIGNFGSNQEHVVAALLGEKWSERITADRDSSEGFRPDRDYRNSAGSSETYIKTPLGNTDILLAESDRPFGADQFYGNFPSWERTKTWFTSVSQDLGRSTNFSVGYRRHSDEFVLVRDQPLIYENNHVSQNWQADLRRRSTIRNDWILSYGGEADGDRIRSNNLGRHDRTRGAAYVNVDSQPVPRLSVTVGAREEIFTGNHAQFVPSLAAGYSLKNTLRLRASASRAFRLPTYTDLYYSDPANVGNPHLKPESAWDFEGGPQWDRGGRLSADLTWFTRLEHNDIDYVRASPSALWQATNVDYLRFVGIEAAVNLRLPRVERLDLSYTALHADQNTPSALMSKYVFNYPSQNAVFSWSAHCKDILSFRTRVGVTQRVHQTPYALWDLDLTRTAGIVRPYLQVSNLTNTAYQDLPGIVMPGRSFIGGLELVITRH